MKKLVTCLGILFFTAVSAYAQQAFQGTIEYSIKGDKVNGVSAQTIHIKDEMVRVDVEGQTAQQSNGILYDATKNQLTMFSEPMLYAVNVLGMDKADNPVVKATADYETIQGYKCRKYEVKIQEQTLFVWAAEGLVSPKINASMQGTGLMGVLFPGIAGIPLRYEYVGANAMVMEVVSIQPKILSGAMFELSGDYKYQDLDLTQAQR